MVNVFFVAMAGLTISVLVPYTIIQLSIFKRDMVVYFLEGCTWKRAVGISRFRNLAGNAFRNGFRYPNISVCFDL